MRFSAFGLRFLQRRPADEVRLFHLAEAVEAGFPDIDRVGNFVAVERQLGFQTQRVARAQAAGDDAEFLARFQDFVPDPGAGCFVRRNVDFESVFAGVAGAGDQEYFSVRRPCPRRPNKTSPLRDRRRSASAASSRLRALDRDLGEVVGQILDLAIELAGVVAHPVEIFFAGAGVDHQQIFILAQACDNHVVHECSLRIEQRRILRLADASRDARSC